MTLGEVVFCRVVTGHQESLTDPSYNGQIMVQTAPHACTLTRLRNPDDDL
jgi:carbamoyl-phosphate synthase small subunit